MRRTVAAALGLVILLTGCTRNDGQRAPVGGGPHPVSTAPVRDEDGRSDPVADPLYPEYGNPALDVLHYDLDLTWTPQTGQLAGTARLSIRATRAVTELALDFADSYTVDSAVLDGAQVSAGRRGNDLVVPAALAPDARATLAVTYHGRPRSVPMPSERTDFPEGVGLRVTADGEAWTMQEPFGAFTWYPANDQPSDEAVYDVAVTVPQGWSAIAHGQLLGVDAVAGGRRFRWRSADPVASYAATLAVGRYTRVDDTGPGGLPMTYWLRSGKDERLLEALRRTPRSLAWLEQRFGPYPFASAGVVTVDSVSAMETQQTVTYGAQLRRGGGPANPDTVEEILLHEFAHEWFGDAVTPTTWAGMWLNEGWAMYAEWLWAVDVRHESDDEWVRWALAADVRSRPVAGPPGHPDARHFGENNVYAGPAYLLHEIHHTVGDAAFFALARDWVQGQRNRPVDRAAFVAFVNQHTGRDFTALINRWLDSPSSPQVPHRS